jgi:hypothetical protein
MPTGAKVLFSILTSLIPLTYLGINIFFKYSVPPVVLSDLGYWLMGPPVVIFFTVVWIFFFIPFGFGVNSFAVVLGTHC